VPDGEEAGKIAGEDLDYHRRADPDYGRRVAEGLGIAGGEAARTAA